MKLKNLRLFTLFIEEYLDIYDIKQLRSVAFGPSYEDYVFWVAIYKGSINDVFRFDPIFGPGFTIEKRVPWSINNLIGERFLILEEEDGTRGTAILISRNDKIYEIGIRNYLSINKEIEEIIESFKFIQ